MTEQPETSSESRVEMSKAKFGLVYREFISTENKLQCLIGPSEEFRKKIEEEADEELKTFFLQVFENWKAVEDRVNSLYRVIPLSLVYTSLLPKLAI